MDTAAPDPGTRTPAGPAPAAPARHPAAAAAAIHSCLSTAELREALLEYGTPAAEGITVLFRDTRTGGFTPWIHAGTVPPDPAGAAVRLHELLEQGDGRVVPLDALDLGPGQPPARAAAALAFRGDAYGLLLVHSAGEVAAGDWQPVADAVATEIVKIQLYESASHESATSIAKLNALNESGELVRYVELEVLLTKLMELSVRIMQAQVGAIVLHGEDGWKTGVEWGLSEEFLRSLRTASGDPFLQHILDLGRPLLIQDPAASDLIDTTGIEQHLLGVVIVPLRTNSETVGAILIANPDQGQLDEAGFDVLSTVANLCAAAVQNALLYEEAARHQRISAEMNLAATVQKSLLPDRAPERPELEMTGWNIPCDETGGDYFDFIDLGEGRTAVVIGDATGHGMGAALMMFIVRSTLRALLTQTDDLVRLLETMNDLVEEVSDDDRFMTLFIGVVDEHAEKLTYATAGHDPPLVLRDGAHLESSETGGVPLGVLPGMSYGVVEERLLPGDIWVFGTDGIWEARNPDHEFYGKERLMQRVRETAALPIEDLSRTIREDILEFHDGAQRLDDITGVFLRMKS